MGFFDKLTYKEIEILKETKSWETLAKLICVHISLDEFDIELISKGHCVPTELCEDRDPVELRGRYFGKFNDRIFYYRAWVNNGIGRCEDLAYSAEYNQALVADKQLFIDTYNARSSHWKYDWFEHWDESSGDDYDHLVKLGLLKPTNDFIREKLETCIITSSIK